jgi:hypothetical protein
MAESCLDGFLMIGEIRGEGQCQTRSLIYYLKGSDILDFAEKVSITLP